MEQVMDSTVEFLEGQLEAFSKSWKPEHIDAIQLGELQGRLKLYLSFYDFIREIDHDWSNAIRAGTQFRLEEAKLIERLYLAWLSPSDRVMGSIRAAHVNGKIVEGYSQFRDAWVEARTKTAIPIERFVAAEEELARGGGRPFAEVMDELRSRHLARGV